MAIRSYTFTTGITASSAPSPDTPSDDAHVVSKGYSDSNYAKRSSFYDKQANNAAIKAISSANRSNGQVCFNYGTSIFYVFDSSSSASDDGDTVLQPDSGTGRWLKVAGGTGGGNGNSLVEEFDKQVSGIVAGQSLANRDAVSIELHNGTGSDVYRLFKADADNLTRQSFVGFSRSSATVTAGIYTYTITAAYVSGNTVPITINGRSYSVSFTTSSDNTLELLRQQIITDPDVASAAITVEGGNQTGSDDRVITITATGGLSLNITGTTVTGGASQPTVNIANTTPPAGDTVDLHVFGPLDGFSSLTPGDDYFLSTTAGSITNNPTGGDWIPVGKALSSTVLFVDPQQVSRRWGSSAVFVVSHGSTLYTDTSDLQTSAHFNLSSWSTGVASTAGNSMDSGRGEATYQKTHHVIDGVGTGAVVSRNQKYNKTSWASETTKTSTLSSQAIHQFNGYLYTVNGFDKAVGVQETKKWNASSWSATTAYGNAEYGKGGFSVSSLLNVVGNNGGGDHKTYNSSDTVATATGAPAAGYCGANCNVRGSGGLYVPNNSTASYVWNGSSWSSSYTMSFKVTASSSPEFHGASAYMSSQGLSFEAGGGDGAALSTTQKFDGTSWSSSTSMTGARMAGMASYI